MAQRAASPLLHSTLVPQHSFLTTLGGAQHAEEHSTRQDIFFKGPPSSVTPHPRGGRRGAHIRTRISVREPKFTVHHSNPPFLGGGSPTFFFQTRLFFSNPPFFQIRLFLFACFNKQFNNQLFNHQPLFFNQQPFIYSRTNGITIILLLITINLTKQTAGNGRGGACSRPNIATAAPKPSSAVFRGSVG